MPILESTVDCYRWACKHLDRLDAENLVQHYLQCSYKDLYFPDSKVADQSKVRNLKQAVQRRMKGEPLAYITLCKCFWNLNLLVSPDVLIPRNETETIIQAAIEIANSEHRVLDLGTGSGAIALTLKKLLNCDTVAADIDPNALEVCAENMKKLNLKITIQQSDWFENCDGTFDVIVSNPPYVAENDPYLSQGDLRFEPQQALVGGTDGLCHLQTIVTEAPNYLNPNGWLIVEHGSDQSSAVKQLFHESGFSNTSTKRDYGGQDRLVQGQYRG